MIDRATEQKVVVDLHGEKAPYGVEIAAFSTFSKHFGSALRQNEIERMATETVPEKSIKQRLSAASNLKLVDFRTGSGIATFEPVRPGSQSAELGNEFSDFPSTDVVSENVRALIESLEDDSVSIGVASRLESARKSLGKGGEFGISAAFTKKPKVSVTRESMARIISGKLETIAERRSVTVTGRLHMLEIEEESRKVRIRSIDGTDWLGDYGDDLVRSVVASAGSVVRATGMGYSEGKKGSIELSSIEAQKEFSQDSLFSLEQIPLDELIEAQGIGATDLDQLSDPLWTDDEPGDQYLEFMLGWTSK